MRWSLKDAIDRKPKCDVSPEGLFSFTGGVGAIEHGYENFADATVLFRKADGKCVTTITVPVEWDR